jgi:hypothetical protein
VKVVDPHGKEVEASVTVEEHDGRKIERENRPGGVRFCDLGITPVTVTVGHPACNQVVVRNVGLMWGKTSNISVIYDRKPCLIDTPPVAACQFLLRFVNLERRPINGVSLEIQKPYGETRRADKFGRALVRIAARQELVAVAVAQGYRPTDTKIPCTSENQRLERFVMLTMEGR